MCARLKWGKELCNEVLWFMVFSLAFEEINFLLYRALFYYFDSGNTFRYNEVLSHNGCPMSWTFHVNE